MWESRARARRGGKIFQDVGLKSAPLQPLACIPHPFAHGWLTVSAGCSLSPWRAQAELGGNDSLAQAGLYLPWPHLLAQAPHLWSSGVEGCPTELGFLPHHVSHCLTGRGRACWKALVSACRSRLSLACGGTFLPWVLRSCSLCVLGVGLPGRWRLGSTPLGFC